MNSNLPVTAALFSSNGGFLYRQLSPDSLPERITILGNKLRAKKISKLIINLICEQAKDAFSTADKEYASNNPEATEQDVWQANQTIKFTFGLPLFGYYSSYHFARTRFEFSCIMMRNDATFLDGTAVLHSDYVWAETAGGAYLSLHNQNFYSLVSLGILRNCTTMQGKQECFNTVEHLYPAVKKHMPMLKVLFATNAE